MADQLEEVVMLQCRCCKQNFEPGDNDQAVCDICRDENSVFADLARMEAECVPLTIVEFDLQKKQREEAEMRENPFSENGEASVSSEAGLEEQRKINLDPFYLNRDTF